MMETKKKIGDVTLEVVRGDITEQGDVDAVVNAANRMLESGGGVAGAIHRAAGTELAEEARKHAPIEPGEAVITGAYGLPNNHVIHCLGPVFGRDLPSDGLLASCYERALRLAEANEVRSIAFPAISTGAFGFPMEAAAKIGISTVANVAPDLQIVNLVRFVLFDESAVEAHLEAMWSLKP